MLRPAIRRSRRPRHQDRAGRTATARGNGARQWQATMPRSSLISTAAKRAWCSTRRQAAGRANLDAILAAADAVVAQNDPGEADQPDWAAIAKRHPHLIVCEIDDLGPTGPLGGLPGSELTIQAMSGFTRYVGDAGGEPCRVGYEVAAMATAMHAYQAIAAGLLHRERDKNGQYVRVSGLNSLLSMKTILFAAQSGGTDFWSGFHLNGPHWPADTGWDTRDGQITFDFRARPARRLGRILQANGSRPPARSPGLQGLALDHLSRRPPLRVRRAVPQILRAEILRGSQRADQRSRRHLASNSTTTPRCSHTRRCRRSTRWLTCRTKQRARRSRLAFRSAMAAKSAAREFPRAPRLGEHTDAVLAEFASERKAAAGSAR